MNVTKTNDRGFTMIEIIVVLLVMVIIGSVMVMSDVYSTAGYDLSSEVEIIKTHLRYAQARAMNTETVWGIEFTSENGGSYSLFTLDDDNNKVSHLLPGEENDPRVLPREMVLSPGAVYFDSWGKPYKTIPATSPGSETITITVDTEAITVTQNTGFIP